MLNDHDQYDHVSTARASCGGQAGTSIRSILLEPPTAAQESGATPAAQQRLRCVCVHIPLEEGGVASVRVLPGAAAPIAVAPVAVAPGAAPAGAGASASASAGMGSAVDGGGAAVPGAAQPSQCGRHPQCTRGFRHPGWCSLPAHASPLPVAIPAYDEYSPDIWATALEMSLRAAAALQAVGLDDVEKRRVLLGDQPATFAEVKERRHAIWHGTPVELEREADGSLWLRAWTLSHRDRERLRDALAAVDPQLAWLAKSLFAAVRYQGP